MYLPEIPRKTVLAGRPLLDHWQFLSVIPPMDTFQILQIEI